MSTLTLTITDVEDGEVEMKMTTDEAIDLTNPTNAEQKLAYLVAALKGMQSKGAPINDPACDTPWLCAQSGMLH